MPTALTTTETLSTISMMYACEYNFPIRVLIYQEDSETIAHAIEMDIVADGDNAAQALDHLKQLIENQITFALQKGEEQLIWRRAPKEYFDRWEAAHGCSTAIRTELHACLSAQKRLTFGRINKIRG